MLYGDRKFLSTLNTPHGLSLQESVCVWNDFFAGNNLDWLSRAGCCSKCEHRIAAAGIAFETVRSRVPGTVIKKWSKSFQ